MTFFKLGKMTFGSLFKKPATTRYPFESRPQPEGLKGQIGIEVEKCILCGACQRNCTTDCIVVNKQERYWEIDRYACIQCGYCITVCPKNCLYMLPDYAPAVAHKIANRFDIPESSSKPAAKKDTANASDATKVKEAQLEPSKEAIENIEAEDLIQNQADHQIEDLLSLMSDERADKVRSALGK